MISLSQANPENPNVQNQNILTFPVTGDEFAQDWLWHQNNPIKP
jgi:hypothetical protein